MRRQNKSQIIRQTFPQMFDNSVLIYGDRPCQLWKSGPESITCLTYDEVGSIVKEMAGGLLHLGIEKQDRVAIMSATSPQWLWADFSILNCGAITVALYPTLSQREMAVIINDSGTRVIFLQDEDMLRKVLSIWDELPSLEKVIIMQESINCEDTRVISLTELRDSGLQFNGSQPFAYERRWRSVDLFDRMTIIYTSGTTGRYKGAVHTHFSMNAACGLNLKAMPELAEEDVFLSFLPLSHSYERQCGQMLALSVGAAIAYTQRPSTILEDMQTFDPTVFMSTPSYFESMFRSIKELMAVRPSGVKAFEKACAIGLSAIDARADEHGFLDMSEGIDLASGLKPDLARKY
ncbi:MAG: AMP-binding protein, partial [Candidatus Saccharibacteria bacterium]